jgi:hypothetical protein
MEDILSNEDVIFQMRPVWQPGVALPESEVAVAKWSVRAKRSFDA